MKDTMKEAPGIRGKILSLVLAVCLVLTSASVSFAEEGVVSTTMSERAASSETAGAEDNPGSDDPNGEESQLKQPVDTAANNESEPEDISAPDESKVETVEGSEYADKSGEELVQMTKGSAEGEELIEIINELARRATKGDFESVRKLVLNDGFTEKTFLHIEGHPEMMDLVYFLRVALYDGMNETVQTAFLAEITEEDTERWNRVIETLFDDEPFMQSMIQRIDGEVPAVLAKDPELYFSSSYIDSPMLARPLTATTQTAPVPAELGTSMQQVPTNKPAPISYLNQFSGGGLLTVSKQASELGAEQEITIGLSATISADFDIPENSADIVLLLDQCSLDEALTVTMPELSTPAWKMGHDRYFPYHLLWEETTEYIVQFLDQNGYSGTYHIAHPTIAGKFIQVSPTQDNVERKGRSFSGEKSVDPPFEDANGERYKQSQGVWWYILNGQVSYVTANGMEAPELYGAPTLESYDYEIKSVDFFRIMAKETMLKQDLLTEAVSEFTTDSKDKNAGHKVTTLYYSDSVTDEPTSLATMAAEMTASVLLSGDENVQIDRENLDKIDSAPNSTQAITHTHTGTRRIDLALAEANDLLTAADGRTKIVVAFSTGVPSEGTDPWNTAVENAAIKNAEQIKAKGGYIYTIGFFKEDLGEETKNRLDVFLNTLSSNTDTSAEPHGFYSIVADPDTMAAVFKSVEDGIVSIPTCVTVIDYIGKSFQLTEAAKVAINDMQNVTYGTDNDQEYVLWTAVNLSGGFQGSFQIEPRPNIVGGIYPTSLGMSGVTIGTDSYAFPIPYVNLPIVGMPEDAEITPLTEYILKGESYLFEADATQRMFTGSDYDLGTGYRFHSEYKKITDTDTLIVYTYTVYVEEIATNAKIGEPMTGTHTIHVITPVFTVERQEVFRGESMEDVYGIGCGFGDLVRPSLPVDLPEGAPEQKLKAKLLPDSVYMGNVAYIVENDTPLVHFPGGRGDLGTFQPLEDTVLLVSVKYGLDQTLLGQVEHHGENGRNSGIAIRVLSGQLTITKTVDEVVLGQKFIFKIEGPARTFYETLEAKVGGTSITITGLSKGEYVITEVDWATQYEQPGKEKTRVLGETVKGERVVSVNAIFENTRRNSLNFFISIANTLSDFTAWPTN